MYDGIFSLIECDKIIEISESIGYEKEIIKHIIHIYNIILIPIALICPNIIICGINVNFIFRS